MTDTVLNIRALILQFIRLCSLFNRGLTLLKANCHFGRLADLIDFLPVKCHHIVRDGLACVCTFQEALDVGSEQARRAQVLHLPLLELLEVFNELVQAAVVYTAGKGLQISVDVLMQSESIKCFSSLTLCEAALLSKMLGRL